MRHSSHDTESEVLTPPPFKPIMIITKPVKRWYHYLPFFEGDYADHLAHFVSNLEIDYRILEKRWKAEVCAHTKTIQQYMDLESVSKIMHAELVATRSNKADLSATLIAAKQVLEESILKFRGEASVDGSTGELVMGPPNIPIIRSDVEAALRHITLAISKERGFTNSHDKHDNPNAIAPELTANPVLPSADQSNPVESHGDLRTGEEVAVGLTGVRVNLHEAQVIDKDQLARILGEVKAALEKRLK